MLGKLLKAYAYLRAPVVTAATLHPIRTAQWVKVPFDLKTAYAPRLTALAAAAVVGPLAFRLGKRSAEGTLYTPGARGRRAPGTAPEGR